MWSYKPSTVQSHVEGETVRLAEQLASSLSLNQLDRKRRASSALPSYPWKRSCLEERERPKRESFDLSDYQDHQIPRQRRLSKRRCGWRLRCRRNLTKRQVTLLSWLDSQFAVRDVLLDSFHVLQDSVEDCIEQIREPSSDQDAAERKVLLKKVLYRLRHTAKMVHDQQVARSNSLVMCFAVFVFCTQSTIFEAYPLPPSKSHVLVTGEASLSDRRHPAIARVSVMQTITPIVVFILHRMGWGADRLLSQSMRLLEGIMELPMQAPLPAYCIRIPKCFRTIALDLDDTVLMHNVVPGLIRVYWLLQEVTHASPLLMQQLLKMAAPHRHFLLRLIDSIRCTGRDVFIVSFGIESWVRPAVDVIFDGLISEKDVYCTTSDDVDGQVFTKNGWLADLAERSGSKDHEVLLIDDNKANIFRAGSAGFSALKLDKNSGLHWAIWKRAISDRRLQVQESKGNSSIELPTYRRGESFICRGESDHQQAHCSSLVDSVGVLYDPFTRWELPLISSSLKQLQMAEVNGREDWPPKGDTAKRADTPASQAPIPAQQTKQSRCKSLFRQWSRRYLGPLGPKSETKADFPIPKADNGNSRAPVEKGKNWLKGWISKVKGSTPPVPFSCQPQRDARI